MTAAPDIAILVALTLLTAWSAASVWQARRRRKASLRWWAETLADCDHTVR